MYWSAPRFLVNWSSSWFDHVQPRPTAALNYRPEIDGLRSIAVLAVIFFHFSVPGLSGGFVGVDVFFVISGFLIGSILWNEYERTGTVSLSRFYVRRFRRLAPAYFAMCAATLIVTLVLLLPFELRQFGKSLLATTVYLSNVFFYSQSGYFDVGAENKILLHTWSLAVEEQFYLFLPLSFLLLGRFRSALVSFLAVTFAVSMVLCIVVTNYSHSATFYLFFFRAWELLAGVLLAILGTKLAATWRYFAAISWGGLTILIGSIVLIEPGTSFPGYQALFPVLGTVLLILNGKHDNIVNRCLAAPVPVLIGLMSYSLYLWHWPILTLSKYYLGRYGGPAEVTMWLTIVCAVSWLSWRYIERPVRNMQGFPPRLLVGSVAMLSAGFVLIGGLLYIQNGLVGRFSQDVRAHIDASQDFLQDWSRCYVPKTGPLASLEVCPIGPKSDEPRFLAWGDSHLRAFKEGIDLAAHEKGVPGLLIWRAGCPTLFDIKKQESAATRQEDASCSDANARLKRAVDKLASVRKVLLVGRWSYYAHGEGTGLDVHNKITVLPELRPGTGKLADVFANALSATVRHFKAHGKEVFILRQVPEVPKYDSRRVSKLLAHYRLHLGAELDGITSVSKTIVLKRVASSEGAIKQLADRGDVAFLDTWKELCSGDVCSAMKGERSIYFDNNHVTNTGARVLRHVFDPLLGAVAAQVKPTLKNVVQRKP